ncbi:leucyl/phenylalanyl-tRNA--protein transferase [Myxococcota bacterium]|nr:leucyl/phenylalanyl-tRNA--protein transferase [Myxococcota bacterium]
MTVFRLTDRLEFPPVHHAETSGLLAVGGDLSPERLILAYSLGIFPWYEDGLPILWHSPDPRMALAPGDLHVSQSLARTVKRGRFEVRLDTAFENVVRACATVERPGQEGTWITAEMQEAYGRLFELGYAHSAEAWQGGELVGGLYGVSLGNCFFGESMFTGRSDASKVAFVTLVRQLGAWGFDLVDCQVETEHLTRFGARARPRERFLRDLEHSLEHPTRLGRWSLDPEIAVGR